ncbi:MAG: S46 family peptidase [Myxococcales bacterium]|nr:S46 family peptidase [Myxococcales bacterium]
MRPRHLRLATTVALPLLAASAQTRADEGMWLPEQLPALAETLAARGLELPAAQLADLDAYPLSAIISLGGCSASFVSDDGLAVTNHHCVGDALQHNSTEERNLIEDGYYAATRADELWAGPGSRIYVTTRITDVTSDVLGAIPEGASDVERFEAIELATKELVTACEAPGGVRCEVADFFAGAEFRLLERMEIQDVRLVYAPAESIGFYGGDDDNWMWPRHTGDWSFLRAYVSPSGAPAPYSPDNVPYHPATHLELRQEDLEDGDFVMVAGYPGGTYRYRTGAEMAWARDVTYPWNIATMTDLIAILDAVAAADPAAEVRVSDFRFGLSNYLKNNEGMLDSFRAGGAVERAQARDAALRASLAARTDDEARAWLAATDELTQTLEEGRETDERDRTLGWMGWSVDALSVASTAYWLAVEREKPDLERDSGYQERDWTRIRERVARLETSFVTEADSRMLDYFAHRLDGLGEPDLAPALDLLRELGAAPASGRGRGAGADAGDGDVLARGVRAAYAATLLTDSDARLSLLDASRVDLEQSRDPIVRLAVALYPLRRAIDDEANARDGALGRLRPQVLAAVRELSTAPIYPDANSTLRVTFGNVAGYPGPDGVWYLPFTTANGVAAKHTGVFPFDAPDALLDAIANDQRGPWLSPGLGAVPVNFLSTLDTTGGNSGSATLDSRGRLCGLLFDGNYESMASDWLFDPVRTRSIHVSTAYMLWVMSEVDHTDRLLDELGVAH